MNRGSFVVQRVGDLVSSRLPWLWLLLWLRLDHWPLRNSACHKGGQKKKQKPEMNRKHFRVVIALAFFSTINLAF